MWNRSVIHILILFVGSILGFFLVFAPLSADRGTTLEYLLALFRLDILFFSAGIALGFFLPSIKSSLSLTAPAVVMTLILGLVKRPDEFFPILIFIVFPLVAVVAAEGGSMLGRWIKEKRDGRKD